MKSIAPEHQWSITRRFFFRPCPYNWKTPVEGPVETDCPPLLGQFVNGATWVRDMGRAGPFCPVPTAAGDEPGERTTQSSLGQTPRRPVGTTSCMGSPARGCYTFRQPGGSLPTDGPGGAGRGRGAAAAIEVLLEQRSSQDCWPSTSITRSCCGLLRT